MSIKSGLRQSVRPTRAEQLPAGTSGSAGLTEDTVPAGAAVAFQLGAVADQRAPGQRLEGRVDHARHIVLHRLQRRSVCGFGEGVLPSTGIHELHKLLMKRGRLGTERLISPGMRAEQRSNPGRYPVSARRRRTLFSVPL